MKETDFKIEILDTVDSTNRELVRRLKAGEISEQDLPTVLAAKKQTQGRGRSDRSWISPEGSFYASLLVPIDGRMQREWVTWVPIVTALSVHRVLTERFQISNLKIKWPNDLMIDDAKLGGILVEVITQATTGMVLVIGVGINVSEAPKTDRQTTCLKSHTKSVCSREDLLQDLYNELPREILRGIRSLSLEGPGIFKKQLNDVSDLHSGDELCWGEAGREKGQFLEIGPSGELRVKVQDGTIKALYSEDVNRLKKTKAAP